MCVNACVCVEGDTHIPGERFVDTDAEPSNKLNVPDLKEFTTYWRGFRLQCNCSHNV